MFLPLIKSIKLWTAYFPTADRIYTAMFLPLIESVQL